MKQFYLLISIILLFILEVSLQPIKVQAATSESMPPGSEVVATIQNDPMAFTVTGTVIDENGDPFPGVTISVKGTVTGTISDIDGQYSIEVSDENSVLVFSFIGYITQEVSIGGRSVIDVTIRPDLMSLGEVVVVALGLEKDTKKLGYSVTSVNTEELVVNRTTNVMESLTGRVAGLNITAPAAGAGASTQIRLRGQSAFAGSNNAPLIVINGLPLDQEARGANGAGQQAQRDQGDNLQNINPDDIESMTVLKGATAAALYGARAAAGAIIITTKSGKKDGGMGVEFTSSFTSMEALNYMDELVQTEYGIGTGGNRPMTQGDAQTFGQFGFGARLDGVPTMNFDGVMRPYSAHPHQLFDFLRNGSNFTNTIALSGGSEKGSFRVSFSDTDAKGIVPNNDYKKRIFNIGINHDITSKLRLQLNVNYANEENINPPQIGTQGSGAVNFFTRMGISTPIEAYRENAVDPVTGAELRTNGFLGTINNPYYDIQNGQYFNDNRNRLLGTATLRYQITDWLYAQGRYNYNRGSSFVEWNDLNGSGATTLFAGDGSYRGSYNIRQGESTDINADFLVGAFKEFGKLSVDANFGGNTWRVQGSSNNQTVTNFTVPDLYSIENGAVRQPAFNFSEFRVNSLYGWAEFGYDDMLFLNITGRQDWFSVLDPANNSAFYPSVSGSFVFSEIMKGQDWLTFGKIRASWARAGRENGANPYENVLRYAINPNQFNGQTIAGISGFLAPNALIQPYNVTEKEIGVELRLFNNKVLLDVAAFDKVTEDQIIDVTISNASGYNNSRQNQASLRNSGFETLIEVTPLETSSFRWITSWNNAYLHTNVLDVGNESGTLLVIFFNGTGNEFLGELRYTEGLPMNQLYTRTYRRNDAGQILVNDDGRLLATTGDTPGAELTNGFLPVGSSIPKWVGGWNNTFTYKKLSMGVHIEYNFGGTVMSATHLNLLRQGHSKMSLEGRREGENGIIVPNSVYASSGEPNTTAVTNLQAFYADYRNLQIGDPFVFSTDFIRIRNVSLAYNLTDAARKVPFLSSIGGLTVSAAVRNLAFLHRPFVGLDPEAIQSSGDFRAGYENSSLPTTRNYNFSLNVRF